MNDLPTLPLSAELLQAYLRVSEGILSSAAPQEKTNAGLSNDPQYARALQGLQLVAQYHQTAMMQTLTSWRQSLLEAMNTSRQRDAAIKRAVLELLFLNPAMMLLSELVSPSAPAVLEGKDASGATTAGPARGGSGRRPTLEPQHKHFCELVQQMCFHWLLAADEKLPSESMPGIRHCLLTTVTEAIGALSRVSLAIVGNPFLKHLTERVNLRRDSAGSKTNQDLMRCQILRLCSGMHHVQLTLDSDEGVREAVSWLRRAHPLDHTTSQRKSQVHHALAEMMSNILGPLVRSELPLSCPHVSHDVLDEWFALITSMKERIWTWTQKHDKHTKDGWTLYTILVCLLDNDQYPVNVDNTVQFFLRQLEKKTKEVRGLVMRCLIQLIVSYLMRYGKGEIVRPLLNKWLDHVVKPLLNTAKKGGFGMSELQELTAPIAELAPEYALGTIILDLLTSQVPPDCTLASLRALYSMVTTVPPQLTPLLARATDAFDTSVAVDSTADLPLSSFTKGKPSYQTVSRTTSGHPGTTRSSTYKGQAGVSIQSGSGALELLRRGMHPFDLLGIGHLMPKLSSNLSKLLDTWHKWYGTNAAYNNPENYSRERNTNVGMFCWLIRLIPYTKPDQWGSCKPLNLLPTYMTHMEPSLRTTAHEAVLALVKGLPHVRNMMLVSYVSCLSSLNDDQHQLVRASLVALRNLARVWLSCLSERAHARGGGAGCVEVSWTTSSGPRDSQGMANGSSNALSAAAAASGSASGTSAEGGMVAPGVLSRLWWCCELSGPDALLLDVHRLEGFAMGRGLVSADEGIRREALQFLEVLRSLHRAILEAQPYSVPPPPSLLPDLLLKGSTAAAGSAGADGAGAANNSAAQLRSASSRGAKPAHRRGGSAHAGPGSSSDGSSWLEGNMLVAGGEGPQNPGPRGLADMVDPPNLTYLLDIIEQGGEHMVRSAYWDCGDWSDLWQACRPMPPKMPSLEALLCSATRDDVARLRLSRVLIALASTTAMLSPLTAAAAVHELNAGRLMRMLIRENNRLYLPPEYMDGKRADAWRNAASMAAALPTSLRDSLLDKLVPLGPFPPGSGNQGSLMTTSVSSIGGKSVRLLRGLDISELVRALLGLAVMVGSGPAALQLAPLMGLGHLHHEHYPVLVEELIPVMEEYGQNRPTKAKPSGLLNLLVTSVQRGNDANDDASRTGIGARSRPDEARRVVAHVFRIVAGAAPRDALEVSSTKGADGKSKQSCLRTRMVDWMRETYFHLRAMLLQQDVFWDNVQVAYCLASAVRASALSISDALNEPLVSASSKDSKDSSNHYPLALKGDMGSRILKGSQLSFRKALYELLRFWSCEGFSSEENYASNVKSGIAAVLGRYKERYEEAALEPVRSELAQAGQYLDHAARTGMAALLAGPVFDADARRPQGPVLQWIERLLTHRGGRIGSNSMSLPQNQGASWSALATTSGGNASSNAHGKVAGPERQEVARMALHNLLHANLDMFATCLDKCYDANRVVASSFFQVICEVYATQTSVHIAPHVMLSLILYKMVDEARDVREDSLHMLHVLSQREWGVSSGKASGQTASLVSDAEGGGAGMEDDDRPGRGSDDESASESELGGAGGDAVVVLGNLQDSYQQFQYQLSCKLARDHLELSEALCEEMMTRALECWDSTIQHPVLICLAPWMENLIISPHWKGSWCERLLKSMYYVTQRHGPAFPFEIERLWSTLAATKRNIIPILDFLTSLGVYAALQESASLTEYFAVAKRIALYLARISPQHTIDHLAYEISLQAHEDDGSVAAAPGAPMPLSFSDITGPENIASLEKAQSTYGTLISSSLDTLDPLVVTRPAMESHSQAPYDASQGLDLGIQNEGDGPLGIRSSLRQESAMDAYADMPRSTPTHMEGAHRITQSGQETSVARSLPSTGTGPGSVVGTGPSATAGGGGGGSSGAALERMPSNASARSSPSVASGSVVEKNGDRNSPLGVQGWGGTIRNLAAISVRTGDEPILERSFPSPSGSQAGDQYSEYSASTEFAAGGGGGGGGQGISVKALLSRPELALCLLAEVAYEHDEDFRPHMPLLLHACICVLDQEGDIEGDHGAGGGGSGCTVSAHAQQLLMHLLYSVSARYIEAATDAGEAAECPQVSVLIRYLLSMRGRRLWAYEDADPSICPTEGAANAAALPSAAALSAMVGAVNDALAFEVGLQASWSEASLDWALHCRSRHLSCRSFQVFRALRPQLTSDVCCTLLVALQHCFAAAAMASSPHAAGVVGGGSLQGSRGAASAYDLRESLGLPSVSTQHTGGEPSGPPLVTCLACAQEIITTLKSLIEGLESSGRLVIYPQLFWVALALLHSSSVPLYGHALSLLDVVMSRLKLHQSKVAAVLLASAPTSPGMQAAGPLQHAVVTQGIWTGLKAASRHRVGADIEEQEEQPELWLLGIAPLGMMPYFQHHFDSPLAGSSSGGGAWGGGDLAGSRDSGGQSMQSSGGVHCSIDWGASSSPGLGVRYAPLAMQQLLLRGLLVGDTAAASLRALSTFADALAQQGYAANEHQRQRLRSSASAPSACASQDAAGRASRGSSMAFGHASATGTVRSKGRPGSSIWGQDSGPGSPNFPQVGLTGTIRHKPSSSVSQLQHEQQHQQQQQQAGLRRLATSGDSCSSSRGGMPSAWGDTAGSHASAPSALRPYDSLRAHATLRMDAHQSLLGPWQGQLFVSLVGVLQVMASLQSARTPAGIEGPSSSTTTAATVATKGSTHAHAHSSSAANVPAPASGEATISGPRRDTHTLSALVQCLTSLTHVATAHGLPALASALAGGVAAVGAGCTSFSPPHSPTATSMPTTSPTLPLPLGLSPDGVVPSLDAALQSICAEMARALFPRFAPLFIHHCLEELTAPGLFPQAHIAAITLLRSMMLQATASLTPTSPGTAAGQEGNAHGCGASGGEIDLGPGVINSFTNTSLLAPLVERTQGPLAPQAVSALSAVMAFTTAHMRRSAPTPTPKTHLGSAHSKLGPGSTPSSQPGTPSRAGISAAAGGKGYHGSGGGTDAHSTAPIVLRTLQPPPGSDATVAAAVKRVADTMGGMSARRGRRTARIIPYLNPSSQQTPPHHQQHMQQQQQQQQ